MIAAPTHPNPLPLRSACSMSALSEANSNSPSDLPASPKQIVDSDVLISSAAANAAASSRRTALSAMFSAVSREFLARAWAMC
jgi:hypothetical protein